jgi:hypothetical protein
MCAGTARLVHHHASSGEWDPSGGASGRSSRRQSIVLLMSATILVGCSLILLQLGGEGVNLLSEQPRSKSGGPKHEKPGGGGRGRSHAPPPAPLTAASLKRKSENEDNQSRGLRIRANKLYDTAHELLRNAGVLTQKEARVSKSEAALKSLIQSDVHAISADKRGLIRVGILKKEIAKMRLRVSRGLKNEQTARAAMQAARKRLVRDEGRLGDQRKNAGKLLKDAKRFADEAVRLLSFMSRTSGDFDCVPVQTCKRAHLTRASDCTEGLQEETLKKSQVLRLNSESSTTDTSTVTTHTHTWHHPPDTPRWHRTRRPWA